MPYAIYSSGVRVRGVDRTKDYPKLEAALEAVKGRVYPERKPGERFASFADDNLLLAVWADLSERSADILAAPVTAPDGSTGTFAEMLQGEGLQFTVEGAGRMDVAIWAPGRPKVRRQKAKSLPRDVEEWLVLSDEELGRRLREHFFPDA